MREAFITDLDRLPGEAGMCATVIFDGRADARELPFPRTQTFSSLRVIFSPGGAKETGRGLSPRRYRRPCDGREGPWRCLSLPTVPERHLQPHDREGVPTYRESLVSVHLFC
ncbi:MAG: hypothetical protein OXF02_01815 [Simkaniaceae bacterium]|nr:hypothetical protein [Simkaniaceae bacterium]